MGLSTRETIGAVLVVAMVAAIWVLLVRPEQARGHRLVADLAALERKAKEAQVSAAELAKAQQESEGARARIANLQGRVLSTKDMARVLGQLSDGAEGLGVRIIAMKPLEERPAGGGLIQRLPVEMELQGEFLGLGRYLEGLYNGSLFLSVEGLRLQRLQKGSDRLTIRMVAVAYMWRQGS